MVNAVIFREYDIRGIVGKEITGSFAENLGKAYATYLIQQKPGLTKYKVTIGHDARTSCPELTAALSLGMRSCGLDVVMIGLVTTPIQYFSTFTMDGVVGGVMVTGSHNPPEYNGFKISVGNSTIYGDAIQALYHIMVKGNYVKMGSPGTETKFDIFPSYIERYKKEFGQIPQIPIVLDCGNGTAGIVARRLFDAVGLKPVILFEEPDGTFPNHHPDPTVEHNLVDLKKAVKEHKARVGIGFDGDSDRIGLVDDKGRMLYGDELMVLISRDVLKSNPGKPIIGDVKCSDRLYADIEKNGGRPIMWKTGHSLIKQKIKEEKAPFGGEMSGHVFFADRNYGFDDALYAALRVIEILAKTGKTIDQLLEGLPKAFNTPEIRVDTTEEKKRAIVEALKRKYADSKTLKVNLIDGIRISFADGWALARASNTQPVLVLRFESSTEEGMKRIQQEIESVVNPLLG